MDMKLDQLRSHFEKERERLAEELRRLGGGNLSAGVEKGTLSARARRQLTAPPSWQDGWLWSNR